MQAFMDFNSPTMKSFKQIVASTGQYFKYDDPSTFRTDYVDKDVDRERKPKKPETKWTKYNFLNAFAFYPSNYSPAERKLLMKIDFSVILFLYASFYTKYLDNTNISAAYVSGMKEELHLLGNELNIFNTCYTVGYAVFQVPITLLITKPEFSRYLLIVCELIWGSLTLANAYANSAQQVYVIRFFIGVFEACSFPATYMVLSSFYSDDELFKRAGLYGAFSAAGSASSGALQTITFKNLSGVSGLAGWRWQFIIDSVITYGIVVFGFFFFPGIPTTCKNFGLFTEDDMILARKRVEKTVAIPKRITMKTVKETLFTWQFYVCCFLWVFHHECWYANGANLYMKSRPDLFTQAQVTTWYAYTYLPGIACTIIVPALAYYYGKFIIVTAVMLTAYYSAIILLIWDVPNSVLMSAFFMLDFFKDGLSQLFFPWAATLCRDNAEKKALVLGFMQAFSYATNAWVIPLQYNLKFSPSFKPGYITNLVLVICTHVTFLICWVLSKYDKKFIPRFAGNRSEYIEDKNDIRQPSDEENSISSQNTSNISHPKIEMIGIDDEKDTNSAKTS